MALYLVRHGKAGSRERFDGPDDQRPLTANGRAQADALAERFRDQPVPRVLSSPYVRCVQTVEPLARAAGVPVEPVDALAEGRPFEPVLELLASLADGCVLCTHGDVLPDVLAALERRGTAIEEPHDLRKGVTWVLERDPSGIRRAFAVAPGKTGS